MAPPQEEDAQNNAGAAVAAAEVRYVQAGIQLHIEPFHIPENKLNIGNEWEEWIEIFEEELQLQKVEDTDDKVTCLRRYGGKEIRKLVKHLPEPPASENPETNYEKIRRKLNLHFVPKKNKQHARYLFSKERMKTGESIAGFTARLREKAEHCDFDDIDDRILEHIVQHISDENLVKKTIQKKWNFEQFIEEAGERENLNTEVSDMRNEFMINKVKPSSRGRNSSRGRSFGRGSGFRREDARNHNPVQQSTAKKKCWYCDQENHPLRERESCPAYGKYCLKCGRPNHFAICCRGGRTPQSSRGRGYPRKQQSSQNRVKKLEQEQEEEADEESDDSSYTQQEGKHIEHVGKLKTENRRTQLKF